MKKFLIMLFFALICFAVNAASLCGDGFRFDFTPTGAGGDLGNVVMTMPNGDKLHGSYGFKRNNIRIIWNNGGQSDLIYVRDGVYTFNERVTVKECR